MSEKSVDWGRQQRISFVRAVKPLTVEREKERKVSARRPVRGSSFCSLCSSCSARKASETAGLKKAVRLIETHLANLCVTSPPPDPNVTPAFMGSPVRTRSPRGVTVCASSWEQLIWPNKTTTFPGSGRMLREKASKPTFSHWEKVFVFLMRWMIRPETTESIKLI